MELTCPSCDARYRAPDGAIGERGRQVSCSACGHGWHAVPPLVLGAAQRTPGAVATDAASGGAAHRLREDDDDTDATEAEVHPLRRSDPARAAQLSEIREMIAEVQSEDRVRPSEARDDRYVIDERVEYGAAPAAAAGIARPRTEPSRADAVDESGEPVHQDPLRRRMAEHDARAARERHERERLRRSMRQRSDSSPRGAGAFLTGFLLVVLIFGAMLAAYLMHPEIIARAPETAPVLTEYVAAVDDLRAGIAEGYVRARAWVMDVIADTA